MPKKKVKRAHKVVNHHETNAKAAVALFVLLLAFGVFLLFNAYQDTLVNSSSFQLFMVLTVVGFGLLIGLLYLVANPQRK